MKILKKYYPVLILMLSSYIYSLHYLSRLTLPTDDESLYARGDIVGHSDWGPLYSLYYNTINSFTHDSFKSLYYNYFALSFILVPFITYLTLRNLKMNVKSSSFGAIIALLSYWNMPMDPKVQIFNYILVLIAFNIRWVLKNSKILEFSAEWIGKTLFYAILAAAIYVRQDNILIIGIALLWDLYHTKSKWLVSIPAVAIAAVYYLMKMKIGNTFSDTRSVEIFLDHFWTNNPEIFSEFIKANIPRSPVLDLYFKNPQSLWDIFSAHPAQVINHFVKNVFYFPRVSQVWSIGLETHWKFTALVKIIFVFLIYKIFTRGIDQSEIHKVDYKEISLFSLALTLKCLAISIFLNWWLKYFFEISIVMTIWGIIIATVAYNSDREAIEAFIKNLIQKAIDFQNRAVAFFTRTFGFVQSTFNLKPTTSDSISTNWFWFIIPALFIFQDYQTTTLKKDKGIINFVEIVRKENAQKPVHNILSGSDFYSYPVLNPILYHLYINRNYDKDIKADFKKFLERNEIDTIILYEDYRARLKEVGMEKEITDFENHYADYGYEVKFEDEMGQRLYRRAEVRQ